MGGVTRAPVEVPPFTIGQLRKALPAHCFERSLLRSSAYLAADLAAAALLLAASQLIPAGWPGLALWPAYWFLQGAVLTGVWVVAHECGHGAFSPWQPVNDGVGLVLHSCLLVPYFSWKHSHRRHHSNTANMERDEVFVPTTYKELTEEWQQTAAARIVKLALTLTVGWPLYLFFNVSGRKYERPANHFDPYSPIFSKRERLEILASDAALGLVLTGLGGLARAFGWAWLLKVYVVPYLVVNAWLVTITLLQHTHPALPHYEASEWDWLRGALATVDRSYGLLDHVFHHIADTHVAHHLFSGMPHYHAREATAALKPLLGRYYQFDARSPARALIEDWLRCTYVAPDPKNPRDPKAGRPGVLWFRTVTAAGTTA